MPQRMFLNSFNRILNRNIAGTMMNRDMLIGAVVVMLIGLCGGAVVTNGRDLLSKPKEEKLGYEDSYARGYGYANLEDKVDNLWNNEETSVMSTSKYHGFPKNFNREIENKNEVIEKKQNNYREKIVHVNSLQFKLLEAVRNNEIEKVKSIIEQTRGGNRDGAMILAIRQGNVDMVKYLQEVVFCTQRHVTTAVKSGNLEIIDLVLKDSNMANPSALAIAVKLGNEEIINRLEKAQCDSCLRGLLKEVGKSGQPLLNALQRRIDEGRDKMFEEVSNGSVDGVVALLKSGVPAEPQNLILAAATGNLNIVLELLGAGAEINVPLAELDEQVVKKLKEKLPNNLRNSLTQDSTALTVAVEGEHEEVVLALLRQGFIPDDNSMSRALQHGSEKIVAALLWQGGNANARFDDNGKSISLLAYAFQINNISIVRNLLDYGAKAWGRELDKWLIPAIKEENLDVVETLLQAGVSPNQQDRKGKSALMMALEGRVDRIASMLVQYRADLKVRSSGGQTPLMMAINKDMSSTILQMLEHGADPNEANNNGEKPISLAVKLNKPLIVIWLKTYGAFIDSDTYDEIQNSNNTIMINAINGY